MIQVSFPVNPQDLSALLFRRGLIIDLELADFLGCTMFIGTRASINKLRAKHELTEIEAVETFSLSDDSYLGKNVIVPMHRQDALTVSAVLHSQLRQARQKGEEVSLGLKTSPTSRFKSLSIERHPLSSSSHNTAAEQSIQTASTQAQIDKSEVEPNKINTNSPNKRKLPGVRNAVLALILIFGALLIAKPDYVWGLAKDITQDLPFSVQVKEAEEWYRDNLMQLFNSYFELEDEGEALEVIESIEIVPKSDNV